MRNRDENHRSCAGKGGLEGEISKLEENIRNHNTAAASEHGSASQHRKGTQPAAGFFRVRKSYLCVHQGAVDVFEVFAQCPIILDKNKLLLSPTSRGGRACHAHATGAGAQGAANVEGKAPNLSSGRGSQIQYHVWHTLRYENEVSSGFQAEAVGSLNFSDVRYLPFRIPGHKKTIRTSGGILEAFGTGHSSCYIRR